MSGAPGSAVRRRSRAARTGAVIALAGLASAGTAQAHGLVARRDLPIPEWLFSWVAAAVLVLSFVLLAAAWSTPRLAPVPWRPLGSGASPRMASAIGVVAGVVGVALLVLVVLAGFTGSSAPTDNFAPTFVLIVFWVGLAFASVLFGDVFRLLSPWRAIGRAAGWAIGRRRGRTPARPYPGSLGCWPAVAGLLAFAWLELASGWPARPERLAAAIVAYSALMMAGMAVYGADAWTRRGEAFSVYFGLLARLSVFEVRDRRIGLRPPLAGLSAPQAVAGTVAFVATMIGSVTFDGLSEGPAWREVSRALNSTWLDMGVPIGTSVMLSATLGLVASGLLVAGIYRLAIAGVAVALGARRSEDIAGAFAFSLVPIAMAYVAAHYLTLLLFEGQAIAYLASDPLGRGWNLFGTAAAGIDYSLLSATSVWYLKVGLVVAGHVGGLVLAHDRALQLADGPRAAVRSQYPMLAVMVAFTSLALWLLSQDAA